MSVLSRWPEIWQELGLAADMQLHADLRRRYSEPHRVYHTLHHVSDCLEQLQEARNTAQRPAELELALWFHDAIYDVRRSDNEARSAAWVLAALRRAGAPPEVGQRIHDLVMATCHTTVIVTADEQLMSDIDLSILGASAGRFDEYEQQMRREYAHVPTAVYKRTQQRILQDFMERERIYHTEVFYRRYEAPARANLQRSLQQLGWWN